MYHQPVLLKDCINGLRIKSEGVYVDVTFGGGGHSKEILKQLGENGKLIGFDQDQDAAKNSIQDPRFIFIPQNFRYLKNALRVYGINQVDGILADFGVSSHQFDEAERGFSIRFNSQLDMRMNQKGNRTALQVINEYEENQLIELFRNYGELIQSKTIAKQIIKGRTLKPLETTGELIDCIKSVIRKDQESKTLSQVFQAIRIEVNEELEVIKDFLSQTLDILKPEGRLVIISYHSLEDRLVKNFMKSGNVEGVIEKDFFGNVKKELYGITKKPIVPNEEEIKQNPRARSAKLRIAEKK